MNTMKQSIINGLIGLHISAYINAVEYNECDLEDYAEDVCSEYGMIAYDLGFPESEKFHDLCFSLESKYKIYIETTADVERLLELSTIEGEELRTLLATTKGKYGVNSDDLGYDYYITHRTLEMFVADMDRHVATNPYSMEGMFIVGSNTDEIGNELTKRFGTRLGLSYQGGYDITEPALLIDGKVYIHTGI